MFLLRTTTNVTHVCGGRHGRDRIPVDLQLHVQSVPITIKVLSSNPVFHGEVYLRHVGGSLRVLRFSLPIKLTAMI